MEDAHHNSVRASYDAVASAYADHFADELERKPLDRALLATIIELAGADPNIVDLGCGPGHAAGWLTRHGARAVGVDLSPAMVEVASRLQPDSAFRVGDLCDLPAADGEFSAAVALYSLIHLAESEMPVALGEVHRILRPNSPLLVGFHVGTDVIHRDEWFERDVDLDFRLLEVPAVRDALDDAGFTVTAELTRRHYEGEAETTRAYLLATRRPT